MLWCHALIYGAETVPRWQTSVTDELVTCRLAPRLATEMCHAHTHLFTLHHRRRWHHLE